MSIDVIPAADAANSSLSNILATCDNDNRPLRERWQTRHDLHWSDRVGQSIRTQSVSVVIPMRNRVFAITAVLDALEFDQGAEAEVIVVDDASNDDSAFRAAAHHSRPTVVRLPACPEAG